MRVDRPADRWFARTLGALSLVMGAGLGAALAGPAAAAAGSVAGLGVAAWLERRQQIRHARRRAALARPFPARWRRLLRDGYGHYRRLPDDLRGRFEDDVRIFLAEKAITGVGVRATEELRLFVAASAVSLSLGWPAFEWHQISEVLLYARAFDEDYSFDKGRLGGMAHPTGPVIISVPSLRASFENREEGHHVGLHEFAHLLDLDEGRFDGVPQGFEGARRAEWVTLMKREMKRLRQGKSALDPYGAADPAEFLAVAVEAFFELPLVVRHRHRDLYAILTAYFRQDPAAWEGALAEGVSR